jgi:hypothetical protein
VPLPPSPASTRTSASSTNLITYTPPHFKKPTGKNKKSTAIKGRSFLKLPGYLTQTRTT